MTDVMDALADVVAVDRLLGGDAIGEDYTHDECLTVAAGRRRRGGLPETTEEVAAVLRVAGRGRIPVTARGSGTGLSGAATPGTTRSWSCFERMNRVLEIDTENHVAVVQPGVRLNELDEVTAAHGLVYPVYPGEYSASLGGNVATNAGGMRAVKYGVTRHQVLGLEAVLPGGEVHPQRRQVRQGLHRLRPDPADHRQRGHPGPGHRGDAEALPTSRAPGHRPGAVHHPRAGDRRRCPASSTRASAR